jgi:hypothetical protein
MRDVTLVMAYYENPDMLAEHFRVMRRFSPEVRSHMRVIVVDDGSPQNPAQPGDYGGLLEIYRINVDIRWNQDAARNIGMHYSRTTWNIITDMDHMVPEKTWRHLQSVEVDESFTYKFSRVSAPLMDPYKPHPNSYFISRRVWDMVGGYDERFAGFYGTDGDFRNRLNGVSVVKDMKAPLIRVPREHIHDASTTRYARKTPADAGIRDIKAARAGVAGWKPLCLSFPYERVYSNV